MEIVTNLITKIELSIDEAVELRYALNIYLSECIRNNEQLPRTIHLLKNSLNEIIAEQDFS